MSTNQSKEQGNQSVNRTPRRATANIIRLKTACSRHKPPRDCTSKKLPRVGRKSPPHPRILRTVPKRRTSSLEKEKKEKKKKEVVKRLAYNTPGAREPGTTTTLRIVLLPDSKLAHLWQNIYSNLTIWTPGQKTYILHLYDLAHPCRVGTA